MRKKFIVEVPCTVMDRYHIFAESKDDALRKIADPHSMTQQTKDKQGDYYGPLVDETDHEPETHWDRAVVVEEVES
jgi:hypothetical protein